jgi:hypothetical protein
MKAHRSPATNLILAAILFAACGGHTADRRPPATPKTYEGSCVLAGIEEVPAPVDQHEDAIVLVARYRPSDGGHDAAGPWSLRFQVQRARERDLRLHIEAHPTVLCDVDHAASTVTDRIDLPPFEGQQGTVGQ